MKPDVGAEFFDQLRNMLDDDRISEHFLTNLACEARDWHAPDALAREAPVGPVGDHSIDAIPAPWRNPSHAIDFRQRFATQCISLHRDEPLLCCSKDDRTLAAPAMGIGMGQLPVA